MSSEVPMSNRPLEASASEQQPTQNTTTTPTIPPRAGALALSRDNAYFTGELFKTVQTQPGMPNPSLPQQYGAIYAVASLQYPELFANEPTTPEMAMLQEIAILKWGHKMKDMRIKMQQETIESHEEAQRQIEPVLQYISFKEWMVENRGFAMEDNATPSEDFRNFQAARDAKVEPSNTQTADDF